MKRTRLKSISPKKAKANALYRQSKNELLQELRAKQGIGPKQTPTCERCQKVPGDCFHHTAGRSGVLLWHKPLLKWLCNGCHTGPKGVHANPSQGRLEGLIVDLTRDEYEAIRAAEQPRL